MTRAESSTEFKSPTHIVGIGASAGGLEALERFFDNLPQGTGMAFVVVQHLSPDFKSLMDELLARHTELPVQLVEDGMPVARDHVYLIPPKKEMIISGGKLLLSERDRQQELTLPIDVFFRSLAQDCGERAVAIVLSGGGSDGSRGVRDIFNAGGMVLVQDVASAQFNGMPRTARDAGVAHWVLPPDQMPEVLLKHQEGQRKETAPAAPAEADDGVGKLYRILEEEFGIDFTHYKPSTVTRRIERRLRLARAEDIRQYVRRLSHEREELDALYRDLLIGVTRFFRNEEAFELMEHKVLPDLMRQERDGAPLRLWVAGCATGEEAYSLAILLSELSPGHGGRQFKIFATDVHRGSLDLAARGIYDEAAVANVAPARLARYFLRRGDTYQIVPELRQSIVFAPHNAIKDAPFTRVDLVSCRNMLIYLEPAVQQKVLGHFHFALNRGGVVFLGPSESPGHFLSNFETIDRHWRLYRKHTDVRMPVDSRILPPRSLELRDVQTGVGSPARHSLSQLLGTYDTLLDDYMPPSLLMNDRHELVHAFGGASRFLKLRDGRQNLDVLDSVDDELRMVLGGGLSRALRSDSTISFKGVRLGEENYKISVRRVMPDGARAPHLLASFELLDVPARPATPPEMEIDLDQVSRQQLGALEAELNRTKENLQAAIEELETSNEELQASNEELLASNEELQSTNEELQSVNEELYTVNAEYQRKIAELTELTNDMDNLLASTDVGCIFLDEHLRIRKFTAQIAESFNLLPQDVGRSIETFTNTMDHPELNRDVRQVLETGKAVEREVTDRLRRAYFLRILPYRVRGEVAGAVITLIDVSSLKAAEDALFHERYLLNSLLASVPDAIYFRDSRGRFIRANHAMATRLRLRSPEEAVGKTPAELPDPQRAIELNEQDEEVMISGVPQHYRLEMRPGEWNEEHWDLATRLPLTDPLKKTVGVIGILRDVTAQKLADQKIQEGVRRRDQFLAMLSHELRNPLGAMVTATALLLEDQGTVVRQGSLIKILDRQSKQMARLLDDLLDTSRVTQNKIELRKKVVDLRAAVKEAADAMKSNLAERQIRFVTRFDARPILVDGDEARLQQIHVNLLSNAAKYTPRGGQVTLELLREGDQAIARVSDDGAGIPPEMLGAVFELFVQSSRTLDRAQGGIGVGLTLVRSLVEMHGGTVTAESEGEGKGSTFIVRLPIAAGAVAMESVRVPRRSVARGSLVVVVEDNLDSREMLCKLLEHRGYRCQAADSGPAGLSLIARLRPQVAVIDVGLPGMNGFDIARRIRSESELGQVYLIALTGYGQVSDRARALEAGFDEHLVKPVRVEQLLRLLSEAPSHPVGHVDAEEAEAAPHGAPREIGQ
jgi:two-component system CheB/CheR fusion protein